MEYELTLRSPVGSESITYKWPDRIDYTGEVIETIRWVCEDIPELKKALDNELTIANNCKSLESVKRLARQYNKHVKLLVKLDRGQTQKNLLHPIASRELLRHILQQVYNHAVTEPGKLNQYTPFSSEVYGESSYDLICQVIDHAKITDCDTFIDLGSGIGQVVLQIAASTPCKFAWGIERAECPSRYAEKLDHHFKRLMKWWGKRHGEYKLIKGDFLDSIHSEKLRSATVVFVNNFAFGAALDNQLKERFNEALEGTRIISSKAFCPMNVRITTRTLGNVACIMHVSELPRIKGSVSWTGNAVAYYLHVIDRRKLHAYFEKQKKNNKKQTSSKKETVTSKKSSDSSTPEPTVSATNLAATFESSEASAATTLDKISAALDVHLEELRVQMVAHISQFGEVEYRQTIQNAIAHEEMLRHRRQIEAQFLENEVAQLTSECTDLFRWMTEVGVHFDSTGNVSLDHVQILSCIKELEERNSQLKEKILELESETPKLDQSCLRKESDNHFLTEEDVMSLRQTAKPVQCGSSSQCIDEHFEPAIETTYCHEAQYDISCEIRLKNMIANLLDKGAIEATVQTLLVPIDQITNVQSNEHRPLKKLKLSCRLPRECLFRSPTAISVNPFVKRWKISQNDKRS